METYWEGEYQRDLSRRALALMQAEFAPSTWKAFWETTVADRPASDVAQDLQLSENAAYVAKCRVLRRLRQELGVLIE